MKKLIMMIGAAAFAVGANALTYTDADGIEWTFTASGLNATLGNGSAACIATGTSVDAAKIPWTFTLEGTDYTVTAIAKSAFSGCTKLSGTLTIPDAVTSMGDSAFSGCSGLTGLASLGGITSISSQGFYNCSNVKYCPDLSRVTSIAKEGFRNCKNMGGEANLTSLTSVGNSPFQSTKITNVVFKRAAISLTGAHLFYECKQLLGMYFPGPDSGTSNAKINRQNLAYDCPALKVFMAGPLTELYAGGVPNAKSTFWNVSGCRIFVPEGSNWHQLTNETSYAANNTFLYYGPGQDLDLSFDHDAKAITATPATAYALTNVLNAASTFKSAFGLDTRISVTNTLDLTGVTIDSTAVSGVTFDRLMFAAKTQPQLDAILGAFPKTTPISIDPTGLTENMVIPETYNNVYVKTVPGVTVKRTASGLMIIVK